MSYEGHLRDRIDANALGHELLGQGSCKPNNSAFCCSVIYHAAGATECHNRSIIDDSGLEESVERELQNIFGSKNPYESPLDMCGRAYFVIAIICKIFDWNVSSTFARSISAKLLHEYCLEALLTSTLRAPCLLRGKSAFYSERNNAQHVLLKVFLNCLTTKVIFP